MRNLSISNKLRLGFGILMSFVCVLAGLAIFQLSQATRDTDFYVNNLLPSFTIQGDIYVQLGNLRRTEYRHLLANSPKDMDAIETDFAKIRSEVATQLDKYTKEMVYDDEDRRGLEAVKRAVDEYNAGWDRIRPVSRLTGSDPAKAAEATALVEGPSAKAYQAVMDAMRPWWDYNVKLGNEQAKLSTAALDRERVALPILILLSLGLGIAATILITRMIVSPIQDTVRIANVISGGDLTTNIVVQGKDEIARLRGAFQEMQRSLVNTVSKVRQGSEMLASASAQIAEGNKDLSARTEAQASALQETAASMEELGSTVRQNADSAKQANGLAQSASEVARQGGEVVNQVVSTMKEINDSSRRIADIIAVIDGIAFQTNILALNAAVEAARAGEQGRGFAVVAGEVRTLAQRSAEAAKEIKLLINDSVTRVETGSALVDRAGSTMQNVVASIRRVTDIVGEISAASVEQSAGVAQVGEAMSQMDQATQQNAALVEESAAATESLKQQAMELVGAVSIFKL